jgi:copper chaperone CopZ
VDGVSEVAVDSANHEIRVTHGGNPEALDRIIDIVRRLGYEAALRPDKSDCR